MVRSAATLVATLLAGALFLPPSAEAQRAGPPPGPGGPPLPGMAGGPGPQPERPLVAQFDRDRDGRLNDAERAEARAWLAQQPRGGRGGGGGRGGTVPGTAGVRLTPADVRAYANAPLYDPAVLRTVFIDFAAADWEQELAAFHNTDVQVPATVRVDGRTFREVGVGFRGASSFSQIPDGSKRSLKLDLDFVNEDQALAGYRTLNLLNANNDPTFLRTVLYSEIARHYLPAPNVNFMRVVINGENWGVYANQQQYNKDFLRDFFGTTEGARWKVPGSPNGRGGLEYLGNDLAAYKRLYEIKTKDDPARWADLIELTRVLNQTPPERLAAALEPILDVDGVLRFLAVEVALVNSDGYWTRASDYNIYQGTDGRFRIIPHDMNEAMAAGGGGGRGGGPGGGGPRLDPLVAATDATKPLRSKLLAVPELRERYLGYVRDIAERWLDWRVLEPKVEQYRALIAADVERDTRKLYRTEAFDTGVADLKAFMDQRREYLLGYGR